MHAYQKRMFLFSVEKFDFLIDGRAKSSIDKFIATNPKFEAICEELQTYNGYVDQVPISPIFYEQLFRTKVFCAAFMCLQFGFVIFGRKDFGAKAAHKMLVKLTLGCNFRNIICTQFTTVDIYRQKNDII